MALTVNQRLGLLESKLQKLEFMQSQVNKFVACALTASSGVSTHDAIARELEIAMGITPVATLNTNYIRSLFTRFIGYYTSSSVFLNNFPNLERLVSKDPSSVF